MATLLPVCTAQQFIDHGATNVLADIKTDDGNTFTMGEHMKFAKIPTRLAFGDNQPRLKIFDINANFGSSKRSARIAVDKPCGEALSVFFGSICAQLWPTSTYNSCVKHHEQYGSSVQIKFDKNSCGDGNTFVVNAGNQGSEIVDLKTLPSNSNVLVAQVEPCLYYNSKDQTAGASLVVRKCVLQTDSAPSANNVNISALPDLKQFAQQEFVFSGNLQCAAGMQARLGIECQARIFLQAKYGRKGANLKASGPEIVAFGQCLDDKVQSIWASDCPYHPLHSNDYTPQVRLKYNGDTVIMADGSELSLNDLEENVFLSADNIIFLKSWDMGDKRGLTAEILAPMRVTTSNGEPPAKRQRQVAASDLDNCKNDASTFDESKLQFTIKKRDGNTPLVYFTYDNVPNAVFRMVPNGQTMVASNPAMPEQYQNGSPPGVFLRIKSSSDAERMLKTFDCKAKEFVLKHGADLFGRTITESAVEHAWRDVISDSQSVKIKIIDENVPMFFCKADKTQSTGSYKDIPSTGNANVLFQPYIWFVENRKKLTMSGVAISARMMRFDECGNSSYKSGDVVEICPGVKVTIE